MNSFLDEVVDDLLLKGQELSNVTFVLPSKRAGVFLKKIVICKITKTQFLPQILSIQDFIQDLSDVEQLESLPLLFEFYEVYLKIPQIENKDSFDVFIQWAPTLLQDFNDIDANAVDALKLFHNLYDAKRIEKWNLKKNSSSGLISKYLNEFKYFEILYIELARQLIRKKRGYKGLIYKEALHNLEFYTNHFNGKIVFVGFNALTKCEELIIQDLLEKGLADIYWDVDKSYLNNNHNAGFYFNKYLKKWPYYQNHKFNWVKDYLSAKKEINVIGTPKNVSQIKYVSEILSKNNLEKSFHSTALVLNDESLLNVVLNSLPLEVDNVNITMGYPLQNIPLSNLFTALFKLHINSVKLNNFNQYYYKDVLKLINEPVINELLSKNKSGLAQDISKSISEYNLLFINKANLLKFGQDNEQIEAILKCLFIGWNEVDDALNNCGELILIYKDLENINNLEKEFIYRFYQIFQQLISLNRKYNHIKDLKSLFYLFKQLLKLESLSFKGEPLSGLQVMGMLETRALDFETVILTSVNEGVLPAVKSTQSFIPYDFKKAYKIPTYKDKDDVFAYHFYRLLQRAKKVFLIYNTEPDVFGSGEQSRFITQLEINRKEIHKKVISPKVKGSILELKEVEKNVEIFNILKKYAAYGISPSALNSFVYNPIDFYHKKILKIKDVDEVEETIAANTLGEIVHKSLQMLYEPYLNKYITIKNIELMKSLVEPEVEKWTKNYYKNGDIATGKNYLIFNIAKQFVVNFLNQEINTLKDGKVIKIIGLEKDVKVKIKIKELDFPVYLKGQIDRIDIIDGKLRIIDYKTGKVERKDLGVKDWSLLGDDKKYSKILQVLFYALVYGKLNNINFDEDVVQSGIISFKNLKSGFLQVNNKELTQEIVDEFEAELKKLIIEIFDINLPFIEKENKVFIQ